MPHLIGEVINTVRELKPEDVVRVSELHSRAFPGYMNVMLGRRYVEAMFSWYLRNPMAIALGIFDDSRLVGYVMGVRMDRLAQLSRDLFPAALKGIATHPWLLFSPKLLKKILFRLKELFIRGGSAPWDMLPAPVMGLFGIAVGTEARGKGAGALLIRHFETESLLRANRSVLLSVFADNTTARSLYEKSGWTALFSTRNPNIVYYSKLLAPADQLPKSSPNIP